MIETVEPLSPTIRRIVLAGAAGGLLPPAAAGAHVIVTIPGPQRVWKNAYSLTSSPYQRARYEIIVRRVAASRGGSAWLHDHAAAGQGMEVGPPANLFPIAKRATRNLLISAGIGATPFLSYMPVLAASYAWHHCCKLEDAATFQTLLPPSAIIHTSRNSLDLTALLTAQKLHTHLYVCGPSAFMDAAAAAARALGWPASRLHLESFGGATGGTPFRARLARTGITVEIGPEESLLDALEAAGVAAPSLCRGGACGECELPLLSGVPDHQDHYLSAEARAAGKSIMPCVSRAKSPELVLDF